MSDYLAKDLRLSIRRLEGEIELTLGDDLIDSVKLCYPVQEEPEGQNRRYHLRESMVIGMRRLIGQAIEAGLISDCPGVSMTLNTGTIPEAGQPRPGLSITFSIDEDL